MMNDWETTYVSRLDRDDPSVRKQGDRPPAAGSGRVQMDGWLPLTQTWGLGRQRVCPELKHKG